MSSVQKLKQTAVPAASLVVGSTDGRGEALAVGTEGQVLRVISGKPAWGAAVDAITYERRSFTEAGPSTPNTTSHTLNTTLPAELQGGNKDSLIVTINGVGVTPTDFSLGGSGPYTLTLSLAAIGYSLDSTDTVFVSFQQAV